MLIPKIQQALEYHYDLELPFAVQDFLTHDREHLEAILGEQEPCVVPEKIFVRQQTDCFEFSLYIDEATLATAEAALTKSCWLPDQLDAWLSVVEGVSHSLCLLWHAHHERQIRALDLELQSDIDKWLLTLHRTSGSTRYTVHEHLFDKIQFLEQDTEELTSRYRKAHRRAAIYCKWLGHTFRLYPVVNQHHDTENPDVLNSRQLKYELCRFYRLNGHAKMRHIDTCKSYLLN